MSFTPYNAPLLAPILGDREIAACFSVQADIREMIRFELLLAKAQQSIGMISQEAADDIATVLSGFEPDMHALATRIQRDGMAVPGLVAQIKTELSDQVAGAVHLHCTSQDVIDSSAMVRMKTMYGNSDKAAATLIAALEILIAQNKNNSLTAYTRMQAALPTVAEDRIANWVEPLKRGLARSSSLQFPLQLSGPIGAKSAYDGRASELSEKLATLLELDWSNSHWQTDRAALVELGNWLALVSGHIGKIGTDICLMAQMGEPHIKLSGGGSSSAMPHKQNPILAETLVTLAQFNASLMSPLFQSLNHEQERSGAAWMMEWMIMPQLFVATGASIRNCIDLVEMIEQIGERSSGA